MHRMFEKCADVGKIIVFMFIVSAKCFDSVQRCYSEFNSESQHSPKNNTNQPGGCRARVTGWKG